MELKNKLESIWPEWRERVRKLVKESGDVKVGEVTISQVYGGMRGVKALVTDISYVDPQEGIRFRGYTVPETLKQLPKPGAGAMPYVGGLYYLLLVGEVPNEQEALEVEEEWKARGVVSPNVFDVLRAMPRDSHPMALFSQAVLALQPSSVFAQRYQEGMSREEY